MRISQVRMILLVGSLALFSFNASGLDCGVKSRSEILLGLAPLDQFVTQRMAESKIAGVSYAIFQNGEILASRAYGDGISEPHFQAASISKVMAAFAALKLVETGMLGLDAPLSRYVKTPYLDPQPFTEMVTLRRVLNHTSGMSNDVSGNDRKLYFKPGAQSRYSGAGFLYLQKAVEDSVGKAFDTFMVSPMQALGLKDSTFDLFYQGKHDVGAPYSMVTTPTELGRLFDEIVHPHTENRWVATQMTTPSWIITPVSSRGLGVPRDECPDDYVIHHTGRNFSFHRSIAIMFAKSRTGVVVMTRGEDTSGLPQEIARLAIGINANSSRRDW